MFVIHPDEIEQIGQSAVDKAIGGWVRHDLLIPKQETAVKALTSIRLVTLLPGFRSALPGLGILMTLPLACTLVTAQGSSPWSNLDIGGVGVPGSVRADPTRRLVSGAGADIWGQADSFNFAFVPWDGDLEIVARVIAVGRTHSWAKAGIMVRADLSEFSPHAMVAMTPEQGAAFLRREQLAGTTRDDAHQAMRLLQATDRLTYQQRGSAGAERAIGSVTASSMPRWVRLVRRGNIVIGYD